MKKEEAAPAPPAPPSKEQELLTEIRDLLKARALKKRPPSFRRTPRVEPAGQPVGDLRERQSAFRRGDQALPPQQMLDRHRVGFGEQQRHEAGKRRPRRCVRLKDRWRGSFVRPRRNPRVMRWLAARMPPSAPLARMVKNSASSPVSTAKSVGLRRSSSSDCSMLPELSFTPTMFGTSASSSRESLERFTAVR